jgi:Bacteriocin-protection, YdeI or OmpD-Associated
MVVAAYQQNDYIGWITRAKQQATREKRLQQMLDELATGDRYMHIQHTIQWKPKVCPRDCVGLHSRALVLCFHLSPRQKPEEVCGLSMSFTSREPEECKESQSR